MINATEVSNLDDHGEYDRTLNALAVPAMDDETVAILSNLVCRDNATIGRHKTAPHDKRATPSRQSSKRNKRNRSWKRTSTMFGSSTFDCIFESALS